MSQLEKARAELDAIDEAIVELLAKRVELVSALWAWKHSEGLPQRDHQREQQLLARVAALAQRHGLSADQVTQLFTAILQLPQTRD